MRRLLQKRMGLGLLAGMLLALCLTSLPLAEEDIEDNEIYFSSDDEEEDYEEEEEDEELDDEGTDDEEDFFFSSYYEDDEDVYDGDDEYYYSDEEEDFGFGTDSTEAEEDSSDLPEYGSGFSGVTTDEISGWPDSPDLAADCAFLFEDRLNLDLYAKNADFLVDPGGTVKIMTALMALENSSLTDSVTMTSTGIEGVTDGGLSISAQVGEVFTMEQLLYALLLGSANDAALQIAEQVGGSVSNFVRMMNEKAVALGCKNTTFTNPTGLEDPHQVSTARDMALIMQEAILLPDFVRIANSRTYLIPATNMSGGDRVVTNSFSINLGSDQSDIEILGGKKGYTETSGSTLLWAAKKGNRTLIGVLLQGADSTLDGDAQALMDYGFNDFTLLSLGNDDFDILSGGDVIVPSGTHQETLKTRDNLEGDKVIRTYFFGNVAVGTAEVSPMEEVSDTAEKDGALYLEEARRYSEEKSILPYFLIIGIGLIAVILVARHAINLYKNGEFSPEGGNGGKKSLKKKKVKKRKKKVQG